MVNMVMMRICCESDGEEIVSHGTGKGMEIVDGDGSGERRGTKKFNELRSGKTLERVESRAMHISRTKISAKPAIKKKEISWVIWML